MELTVLAEPLLVSTNLYGKLTVPTKSLTGFMITYGELIALEEPLAVFIAFSRW